MKKLLMCAVLALSLTSCYNTRVLVGSVQPKEPTIEVNRVWNHHLIVGLVPLNNATMKASEYVGDRKDYVVKTNINFVQGLVGSLTFGIYTPTQTIFYVPLKSMEK